MINIILVEFYNFLFILSILYNIFFVLKTIILLYGRFGLQKETKLVLHTHDKLLLWVTISIIIKYLI